MIFRLKQNTIRTTMLLTLLLIIAVLLKSTYAWATNDEDTRLITLESLQSLVNSEHSSFEHIVILDSKLSANTVITHHTSKQCIDRSLIEFNSDDIAQFALLENQCSNVKSDTNKPFNYNNQATIIFLHGYHPKPFEYGRVKDGSTFRPGDYYRKVTSAFVKQGFVVLTPDYRGHNDSDGNEYTQQKSASLYYLRDSINFVKQVRESNLFNNDALYVVGHSMGAGIGFYMSQLLTDEIKAYSLWSMGGLGKGQTLLKSQNDNLTNNVSKVHSKVNLHHAINDKSTRIKNSLKAANVLEPIGRLNQFYQYQSNEHLFNKQDFINAVERDALWFKTLFEASKSSSKK